MTAIVVLGIVLSLPFLVAGIVAWDNRPCARGGSRHTWSQDPKQFRRRICDHCGRAEILMRQWELDT